MRFSSLINVISCKSGKISNLMAGHRIYKSQYKMGKKISKLDDNFFHHMQPKCNINSCEMKTKKENSKNFRKNNDGTDLRSLPLQQHLPQNIKTNTHCVVSEYNDLIQIQNYIASEFIFDINFITFDIIFENVVFLGYVDYPVL